MIYAGCTNGRLQKTTNAGLSWTNVSSGLPTLYITDVEISRTNNSNVYVTFSGFSSSNKVFKTTNGGQNWVNISSNLPNIPVNCIFVNPYNELNLLIGTDLGIFETTNGGTSWYKTSSALPNVAVVDMDFRDNDNTLIAATHGRGMWKTTITTGVENDNGKMVVDEFKLYQNFPNPFNSNTTIRYSIKRESLVEIKLFDLSGKEIATLLNEIKTPGEYSLKLDASDFNLSSGVYLYQMKAGEFNFSRKLVYLK